MTESIPRNIGDFEVISKLGNGAIGEVYKVRKPSIHGPVALKIMHEELKYDNNLIRTFFEEVDAMSSLNHPNILLIFDKHMIDGTPAYTAQHHPTDLRKRINHGNLEREDLFKLAIGIASALEYTHKKRFRHMDLKPSNVYVSEQGEAVLGDYHLVRHLELESEITSSGGQGTPDYMSPEQRWNFQHRRPSRRIDQRSDIYSFGVLLYEMATGSLPKGGYQPISEHRSDLPKGLDQVVEKSFAEKPEQRYQDASEVVRDLKMLRSGRSLQGKRSWHTFSEKAVIAAAVVAG
ncbi:protein kinase, partial [Candidatus Woesearchaeota archaeon]|nr:protein kinase [Candidatus Woesearchaeota archaeon]